MAEVFLFTRQESSTPGKFLINNTAKTNSEKVYKIYDNLASKNEEVVIIYMRKVKIIFQNIVDVWFLDT